MFATRESTIEALQYVTLTRSNIQTLKTREVAWLAGVPRSKRSLRDLAMKLSIVGLRKLLLSKVSFNKLRVKIVETLFIWSNNVGATSLALNHVFHNRKKYIEIDGIFTRVKVLAKILENAFCSL